MLVHTCQFPFFARSQPKGCEVTAHGFDLHSLKIRVLTIFSYAYWLSLPFLNSI